MSTSGFNHLYGSIPRHAPYSIPRHAPSSPRHHSTNPNPNLVDVLNLFMEHQCQSIAALSALVAAMNPPSTTVAVPTPGPKPGTQQLSPTPLLQPTLATNSPAAIQSPPVLATPQAVTEPHQVATGTPEKSHSPTCEDISKDKLMPFVSNAYSITFTKTLVDIPSSNLHDDTRCTDKEEQDSLYDIALSSSLLSSIFPTPCPPCTYVMIDTFEEQSNLPDSSKMFDPGGYLQDASTTLNLTHTVILSIDFNHLAAVVTQVTFTTLRCDIPMSLYNGDTYALFYLLMPKVNQHSYSHGYDVFVDSSMTLFVLEYLICTSQQAAAFQHSILIYTRIKLPYCIFFSYNLLCKQAFYYPDTTD